MLWTNLAKTISSKALYISNVSFPSLPTPSGVCKKVASDLRQCAVFRNPFTQQYRHLIPATVDLASANARLYQHHKPLSHKTMKSTRLYTKLGFFTPCRLRGGLCRLHDKTGTLPGTSYSLQDKPCSIHVRAEIFWLFKNFHELHMKFDLDIHHVNFMLTSCTLRGILVDYWLTSYYFVFTSYPNSNTR